VVSSAGVVVVGNEILSGKVQDLNGPFLTRELRACGVRLGRVAVLPDEVAEIAFEVGRMTGQFDHVITTGGIGATHDDVTLQGVADAFGLPLEPHAELVQMFVERTGEPPAGAAERLTLLPAGAELIRTGRPAYPLVRVRNVFIFPGVPRFLQQKFELLRPLLQGEPFHLRRLFLSVDEGRVADLLERLDRRFSNVDVGSYPKFDPGVDHAVEVTLESRNPEAADQVLAELEAELQADWIVRKE
jgi:FAD synthetase